MPTFAIVLIAFGAAVILFPALLSLLVGLAFIGAGAALLGLWSAVRQPKAAPGARKSVKVGGVEILFPEKK